MLFRTGVFLLIISFVLSACCQVKRGGQIDISSAPRIVFKKTYHDFGIVGTGATKHCNFTFSNKGNAPLIIKDMKTSCMCTASNSAKRVYAPGETGEIEVTYATRAPAVRMTEPKSKEREIVVYSNDPQNPKIPLTVRASVVDLISVEPPKLELRVGSGNKKSQPVALRAIDGKAFSIIKHKSSMNLFDFEYDPNYVTTEHILSPLLDEHKLQEIPIRRGRIYLMVSHPDCEVVVLPFAIELSGVIEKL